MVFRNSKKRHLFPFHRLPIPNRASFQRHVPDPDVCGIIIPPVRHSVAARGFANDDRCFFAAYGVGDGVGPAVGRRFGRGPGETPSAIFADVFQKQPPFFFGDQQAPEGFGAYAPEIVGQTGIEHGFGADRIDAGQVQFAGRGCTGGGGNVPAHRGVHRLVLVRRRLAGLLVQRIEISGFSADPVGLRGGAVVEKIAGGAGTVQPAQGLQDRGSGRRGHAAWCARSRRRGRRIGSRGCLCARSRRRRIGAGGEKQAEQGGGERFMCHTG